MKRTTEADSNYQDLDKMNVGDLLMNMNKEDQSVPMAVKNSLSEIEELIHSIVPRMEQGGRLFYIGAGTSGRLGVVDASECPPTFGVSHDLVVGIIAGGDSAIRKAVEFAEDDTELGWKDLQAQNILETDTVIGIAASGSTPYVIGALEKCNQNGINTGCITCNKGSKLAQVASFPVEIEVGPEFVTGSTRMKSGTAQKLVLNMISTAVMIRLGKVKGNKMVDMQLSNVKLVDRGTNMVVSQTGLNYQKAKELLLREGSVRKAVAFYQNK